MTSHQTTTKPSSKKKWLLNILLLIIVFTATASTWLLATPSGARWLLSTASRISSGSVVFTGVNGTVSALRTESIHFANDDLQLTVHDFALDWQPGKLLSGQLKIQQLSAQNIDVLSPPSEEPSSPAELPENLQLPLSISIDHLKIAALRVFSKKTAIPDTPDFAATEFSAKLESDGRRHQLSNLQINSDLGALKLSAQLDGIKPFNLDAKAKFTGLTMLAETQLPASQLLANISGDLKQIHASLSADGELLNGSGEVTLQPFSPFPVTALRLSLEGLSPKTFSPDAPDANISLQANLRENTTKELSGNVAIKNSKAGALDNGSLPLHEISANLTLSPDLLQLDDLLILLADDGVISGNLSWQIVKSSGSADLIVKKINPLAFDTRLQPARINGTINLNGNTDIQRGIISLKDEALSLDARVSHTDQAVILDKLLLRRHQSTLTGKGKLGLTEKQLFNFEGKLTQFNLSDFIQAPDSNLNLTLRLAGNLSSQFAGTANFKLDNSKLAAQPVFGNGLIEFNHLNQATGNIELAIGSNSLRARGGFGKPNDRLQLNIAAPALAEIETGISGALNLKADLTGSFTAPSIRFEIKGEHLNLPGDHNLNHFSAHGYLRDASFSLRINADDYRIKEKEQLQHIDIAVTGQKSHHQLQVNAQINDEITFNMLTEGSLAESKQANATMQWTGELSQLSATGPLPLNLLAAAKLELSESRISLDTTRLAMAKGQLTIDNVLWTPQEWHSQGKFTGISLRPGGLSEQEQETLQLGGEWDMSSSAQLNGHLKIAREKGDWILPGDFPLPLGLQTLQFAAKASNGKLDGDLSVTGKRIGATNASFSIPITPAGILPDAPLIGQITTNIDDISWIGQLLDENFKSGGRFGLQAKLAGTLDNPELQGNVNGENLALTMLDQGIRLEQGKLAAHFDQASLQIDTLRFVAPDETPPDDRLLAGLTRKQDAGLDTYSDDAPDEVPPDDYLPANLSLKQKPGNLAITGVIGFAGHESNLTIKLDRVPLANETDYWILISGNTDINFNDNTLTLRGNVTADAGFISQPPGGRPQLADDVIIGKQPLPDSEKQLLNLDVTLDLGEHFYIRAAGLAGRLAGQLHLSNDQQKKLYASGTISTRKTIFEAYGQKLTVERGIVSFNGPLDNPGLNVLAVRKGLPVKAGVEVLGTVRRPKIRLVSTPTVPDSEKLSWIVTGRNLESGGADTSLLLAAAGSILGGQPGSSGITGQLSQALGVDEISFRQSGNADEGDPLANQIGVVGKQISSRVYLSYERGLTTQTAGITKLTYKLTPKIRIVTQAGADNALDVFYTFRFD